MQTRLKYQTCTLHDQPMNLLCLHPQCSSDRIICAICRQQRHSQYHFIMPLKIYMSHKTQQIKCITQSKLNNIQHSLFQQKTNINKSFDQFKQEVLEMLDIIKIKWENMIVNKIEIIKKCQSIINKRQIQVTDISIIEETLKIITNYSEYHHELQQHLKRTKDQIIASLSQIHPSQNYTKQKWIHHLQILPLSPTNTTLKSTTNNYKLAHLQRPISKKFNSATFRFLSGSNINNPNKNKWILFGVCQKNIVQRRNYGFRYYTIGHGVYGVSSNGGVWSHDQSQINNKLGGIKFGIHDTVAVSYDFNDNKVQFQNQSGNKISLKTEASFRDSLHFCVVFYYEGDQVEIISQLCIAK